MKNKKTILVTGGAGFIGSHLVDRLIKEGYAVRVLDNLSPPAHNGKLPPWFNKKAEFVRGDVRNRKDWKKALRGVSYVFHLAAYMDLFSDFSTYFEINAAGTALMYEVIIKNKLPIKKIIAASSQAVYGEGKYRCPRHKMKLHGQANGILALRSSLAGLPVKRNPAPRTIHPQVNLWSSGARIVYPPIRRPTDLKQKKWEIFCPYDRARMTPLPQKEDDILYPVSAYACSKIALEHIIFSLGKLYHIPSVALRYSIVQGAHQSFRHFYSGALRAYAVMGLAGLPIETHEDGLQIRDFVNVHDVVDAHLHVLKDKRADYEIFNVGAGKPTRVIDLARVVSRALGKNPAVKPSGHFRWTTARHSPMSITKLKKLGWRPRRSVEDSVHEYIAWVKNYPEAKKYLEKTNATMKKEKLIF